MRDERGKNSPRGSTAKSTAKKPAKKTSAKPFAEVTVKATAKGGTAKRTTAKKATANKTTAKKATAKNATAKNATAKHATAKATTKKATVKATLAKKPPKKTAATSEIVATKTKPGAHANRNERVITDLERAEGESANDREEALRILADIEVLQVEITRSFYDLGLLLKALAAPRLYVALGHTSFEALLRERRVMSVEQARKLIRVVEELDRKRSLKVGMEKAFGLVRLADATKTTRDSAVSLIDDDAPIGDQRVSTASVREVDRARARAAAASHALSPTERERDEAARYAATLRESLRQRGVKATVTLVAGARVRIEADPATLRELLV